MCINFDYIGLVILVPLDLMWGSDVKIKYPRAMTNNSKKKLRIKY